MSWLNTRQAAEYLGIMGKHPTRTLAWMCRVGTIPLWGRGPGGDYRFKAEWLDYYIMSNGSKAVRAQAKKPVMNAL